MKRLVAPALLAVTLLTGCSSNGMVGTGTPTPGTGPASASSSGSPSASPSPTPTKAPVYVPALAKPLEKLDIQDEPMNQFYQGDLSTEEKVTQLRIYEVAAANLNSASPIYKEPKDAYEEQYDLGNITREYRDSNRDITEWHPAVLDRRAADFSHQVTGIYCPMRAQTLKAVEDGKAQCWFTGGPVRDGETVSESTWDDVTGLVYEGPDDVRRVDVRIKKEDGVFKVDGMNFYAPAPKK